MRFWGSEHNSVAKGPVVALHQVSTFSWDPKQVLNTPMGWLYGASTMASDCNPLMEKGNMGVTSTHLFLPFLRHCLGG
ncbi:hypothetical protein I7I48_02146 [Histoplasma ohiense]|nr:hypothetical protein I7I48_02146 [Histoplasma ohiense (nom. inval.)]